MIGKLGWGIFQSSSEAELWLSSELSRGVSEAYFKKIVNREEITIFTDDSAKVECLLIGENLADSFAFGL